RDWSSDVCSSDLSLLTPRISLERHLRAAGDFQHGAAEIDDHLALDEIQPSAPQRISVQCLREVYGIKEIAPGIEPGTVFHGIPTSGLKGLLDDEIAHHADGLALVPEQIRSHHLTAVVAPGEVKQAPRHGKTKELHLIVQVFYGRRLQLGQYGLSADALKQ